MSGYSRSTMIRPRFGLKATSWAQVQIARTVAVNAHVLVSWSVSACQIPDLDSDQGKVATRVITLLNNMGGRESPPPRMRLKSYQHLYNKFQIDITMSASTESGRCIIAHSGRIEEITLKRDLGVLGSFSIGLRTWVRTSTWRSASCSSFAMGAAPLALAVAALGYMFTALSYAELASAIQKRAALPSSQEKRSTTSGGFIAGWGLLLDYTIDIACFGWITMG